MLQGQEQEREQVTGTSPQNNSNSSGGGGGGGGSGPTQRACQSRACGGNTTVSLAGDTKAFYYWAQYSSSTMLPVRAAAEHGTIYIRGAEGGEGGHTAANETQVWASGSEDGSKQPRLSDDLEHKLNTMLVGQNKYLDVTARIMLDGLFNQCV